MRREIKIGIIFTAAIAAFIWGFNFLKGKDILKHHREFYAVYNKVDGLTSGSSVLINGKQVGSIERVDFRGDKRARLVVEFIVSEDIDIPANSVARIESSDLMGTKAIAIKLGESNVLAESGDTLSSAIASSLQEEVNKELIPLKLKFENLMLSIDSVMAVIQYVFNEDTRDNLAKSFENIKFTIDNLKSTSYSLDTLMEGQRNRLARIVTNIESITLNIRENNEQINNIIQNISVFSDSLAAIELASTIKKTNEAVASVYSVMHKIDQGEGSLGLLINNDELYSNLEKSASDLDILINDIKENPERYVHFSVFGKKSDGKKKKTKDQ